MALTPSTIKPGKRVKHSTKRVGRGNGSQKGTYSARGLKGQRARSGGKRGLLRRAFKAQLQKVPKVRGFKSKYIRPEIVTLAVLNRICEEGAVVTVGFLNKKGIISDGSKGVKVVATGKIEKKILVQGLLATKEALAAIEKAGGKLES